MERFWVVYAYEEEYRLLSCDSFGQADWLLNQVLHTHGGMPVGIYDRKAGSFDWEPTVRGRGPALLLAQVN